MTFPSNWHIHTSYLIIGIVLALGGYIGVHSWIQEHDARLLAQQQEKISETVVKNLQQQIADRDAGAKQAQAVIVKVVHDTKTPEQAAQNLPQVVTAPLPVPVVTQPSGDWLVPKADVLPIFTQLADDKICRSQLDTTTKDLSDTKAIVVQKDAEITVLKKPKGFWGRLKTTTKDIGIGLGIGFALGHKF